MRKLLQKNKVKEMLPTTNIIKYLAPSKKALLFPFIDDKKQRIKLEKKDLKGHIIYVATRLTEQDHQSKANNAQIKEIKQQNEDFKADLKKSTFKSKEEIASPLNPCQDLVTLYEEKNYKVPAFTSNTNLFQTNPLIQNEKDIIHFYDHKKEEKQSKILNDKTESYLLKLETITHKYSDNNKIVKTQRKSRDFSRNPTTNFTPSQTLNHYKTISNNLLSDIAISDLHPHLMQKVNRENNTLRKDINILLKTINDNTVNANYSPLRKSMPIKANKQEGIKRKRNKKLSMDFKKISALTRTLNSHYSPETRSRNKICYSTTILNKDNKKVKTQMMYKTTHTETQISISQLQTERLIEAKIAKLHKDIIEKPKKQIIDKLYDFALENDFNTYKACLNQYNNKYHKKSLSNQHQYDDKTSRGVTQNMKTYFSNISNLISNSNEKEVCWTNYNRIGKKDLIQSKLQVLYKLDDQLSKFDSIFIKKSINNEKSY